MAEGKADYEQIFTVLYSRKMTRTNFNKARREFKAQTGRDLCDLISAAQKGIITKVKGLKPRELGPKLRTDMFKLIDYTTWMKYCKTKKKP